MSIFAIAISFTQLIKTKVNNHLSKNGKTSKAIRTPAVAIAITQNSLFYTL